MEKITNEITLLTQKYFQVSDLYKMLIEKNESEKIIPILNQYVFY